MKEHREERKRRERKGKDREVRSRNVGHSYYALRREQQVGEEELQLHNRSLRIPLAHSPIVVRAKHERELFKR